MTSPWIENYPGFPHIEGMKLMEAMAEHAKEYVSILEGVEVVGAEPFNGGFRITTTGGKFYVKGIVLTTGASHRKLMVPGEEEYFGKGVSYCSTCDGFFFRNKKVVVIGGGNTAITDALYLHSIGCDVTLVHRGEALRGDIHLQEAAKEKNIKFRLHSTLAKISGDGEKVTSVEIVDSNTGNSEAVPVDGVFIAVGMVPSSALAKALCVEMDQGGFVKVDSGYRTSVPFVYAAGDLVGGILQVVAAVHGGATAALSAFEDLSNPYYRRTRGGKDSCPVPSKDKK